MPFKKEHSLDDHRSTHIDEMTTKVDGLIKDLADGNLVRIELSNGTMVIEKDVAGFYGYVSLPDGSIASEFSEQNAKGILDQIMADGAFDPVCSACNQEHIDHLRENMEKIEMSISKGFFKEDDVEKDITAGENPVDNDDMDTAKYKNDDDHDDAEILEELSDEDYEAMSEEDKGLVISLMEKHDTKNPPQINEYPSGGYEVRIFADDGYYYYYVITPDHEVVHLAVMGKSMKYNQKLGPTMEDLMRKSDKNFVNDLHVFNHGEQGKESLNKTFVLGDTNLLYPDKQDYETGVGNAWTVQVKLAIEDKGRELGAWVDSITNNNDGTYKAVFLYYGPNDATNPYTTEPKRVAYNFDRDGKATETSADVQLMKGEAFKEFNFTSTSDELGKSFNREIQVFEHEVKKTEIPVKEEFMKSVSIVDVLEDRKKEVLKAQNRTVISRDNQTLDW